MIRRGGPRAARTRDLALAFTEGGKDVKLFHVVADEATDVYTGWLAVNQKTGEVKCLAEYITE